MWDRIRQRLRGTGEEDGGGRRPLGTKEIMLILFLCGILLFVILIPSESGGSSSYKKSSTKQTSDDSAAQTAVESKVETASSDTYKKQLEEELADFLSSVEGVGEVKVLIYIKESQEYIVEKDNPVSSSKNGESSQESKDESTVYTKNDNGDEVPFIAQTKSPAIDGVAVAAEGAKDEAVRLEIVRLVMALYGVEANKVEVSVKSTSNSAKYAE